MLHFAYKYHCPLIFFSSLAHFEYSVGFFSSTNLYMWGGPGPVFRYLFFSSYAHFLCALNQYHINAFSSLMTLKFMSPAQTCPLSSDSYLSSQHHPLGIRNRHLKLIMRKNELYFLFTNPHCPYLTKWQFHFVVCLDQRSYS